MAALGRMPFYLRGVGAEVIGIDDAADAMLRASVRGRVGERCIVSERYMSPGDLVTTAAVRVAAALADIAARVLRRDIPISKQSVWLLEHTSPASHAKATRDLGWQPRPTEHFIRHAAENYVSRSTPR